MSSIKKIAINTGGGDAPGLNAVIRAATISASFLFLVAFLLAVASDLFSLAMRFDASRLRPLDAVSRVDASPPRATRRVSPERSSRVLPPSAPAPISRWMGVGGGVGGK